MPISSSTIRELAELRYEIRRLILYSQQLAAEAGLKPQEHQLLIAIGAADDRESISTEYLSERMGMRRLSMDPYLRSLIAKGYVQVWPEAGAKGIALTESGRRLLEDLVAKQNQYLQVHSFTLSEGLKPFLNSGLKAEAAAAVEPKGGSYRLPEVKGI